MVGLTFCAISGSLRSGSYNTAALRAAAELAPNGVDIEEASLADIPIYNEDVKAAAFPAAVIRLQHAIASADAVLISTPEYNYCRSGWAQERDRPGCLGQIPQPFATKPAAIMGASPGALGTARAQYDLRRMFVYLDAHLLNKPEVMISAAHTRFDASGRLTDEATRKFVASLAYSAAGLDTSPSRGRVMGQLVGGRWTNAEEAGSYAGRRVLRGRRRPSTAGSSPVAVSRRRPAATISTPRSPARGAHRTLIFRRLKGLDSIIGLSITHWLMADEGWTFALGEGVRPDPFGAHALHEIYTRANSNYTGRVSVPVLWDTVENTIVSNESADIVRMFNSGFDTVGAGGR